jgi:hypothetical protein
MEDTPEGYTGGTVDVHEDDSTEHVLPVYVVPNPKGENRETITAFRATQMVAQPAGNGNPVQLAPRNRLRTKLQLSNAAAADGCWISHTPSVNASNGYFLAPGKDVTLSTTEEVYAVSATATPVPVSVLTEFTQKV